MIGKPSPAAARILRLAVNAFAAAGGEAAGVDLLAGLLAAGGHAAYFSACLALVLAARTAPARDAGLAFLTRQNFDMLPIDVIVEAIVQVCHLCAVDPCNSQIYKGARYGIWHLERVLLAILQVSDGLNQAESARHEVPYTLLQKLIQAPCSLAALRQVVATGKGDQILPIYSLQLTHASLNIAASEQSACCTTGKPMEGSSDGQDPAWTASVSDNSLQESGALGGSTSSGSNVLKRESPQVMLLAVQPRGDAVERIELLIGACLQSILRR